MAKSPKKKEAKKGGKGAGSAIAWLVALPLSIVALPTMILLIAGMAPTLVAFFIIDRHPSKYTTRTIGYLNFAGCLPYALELWSGGGVWDFDTVFQILQEPLSLLVMYAAAATGWIIHFATPPVVAAYLAVTSDMRAKKFKERQDELIEDWGRNVRYGAMGEELREDDDEDENAAEAEPVSSESAEAA